MKKVNVLLICLISISTYCHSQATFGISPGIGFSGAHFGIKKEGKPVMPYIALQFVGVSYSWEDKQSPGFSENIKFNLFMPNLGARFYLKEEEQLKTFLNLSITKPFVTGKREMDGTTDDTFKDDLKKINLFGTEASFGAEYFVGEHFALGGEFGLRIFHYKYDGENYLEKYNISPTFSRISFNYYF